MAENLVIDDITYSGVESISVANDSDETVQYYSDAVRYTPQFLTEEQKTQVRSNIGVYSKDESYSKTEVDTVVVNNSYPAFTDSDDGKFLMISGGQLVWTSIKFEASADERYCWVITSSKVNVYDNVGVLIEQYDNDGTWECPADGTYYVELHAKGGIGGASSYRYTTDGLDASYNTLCTGVFANGGGGGGSGAAITLSLTAQNTYDYNVGDDVSTFDVYYCNRGGNGKNGSINYDNLSATGGAGGAVGTYSDGMVCLATAGMKGEEEVIQKEEKTGIIYYKTKGGSGGAYSNKEIYPDVDVFNGSLYGNGGLGGSSASGSTVNGNFVEAINVSGYEPTGSPAIIIVKCS